MSQRRVIVTAIPLALAALMVLALATAVTPRAGAAPQPAGDPVSAPQNAAEWTISDETFQSNFPAGFEFSIKATSTGGAVISAQVQWLHRPRVRENTPLVVRRADGVIDAETGTITAVWEARELTVVPPWVGVYYFWTLRDDAGNVFTTAQASAEYDDPNNEWTRFETDDVLVFFTGLPADTGEQVAEALAEQHEKYVAGWGAALPYKPRAILFGDYDTWLQWQVGREDTTGIGLVTVGQTSDEWGGTVQFNFSSMDKLVWTTVPHEVEHLYQGEFLAGRTVFTPGWWIEGDATFYEMSERDHIWAYVNQKIAENDVPILLQGDGPTTAGADALDGYYIGYTFFAWVDDQWGIEMHRKMMNLLAEDVPFTTALEQATGLSVIELESRWRVSLGMPAVVPTLVPTWTPIPMPVFVTPTPMS